MQKKDYKRKIRNCTVKNLQIVEKQTRMKIKKSMHNSIRQPFQLQNQQPSLTNDTTNYQFANSPDNNDSTDDFVYQQDEGSQSNEQMPQLFDHMAHKTVNENDFKKVNKLVDH